MNKQLYGIFKRNDTPEEMIGLPWEKWSEIMADTNSRREFIQSLDDLIDSAFLSPDEEHSFIYGKT